LADLSADDSVGHLADIIWERTAGNPFFIEEVVRALVARLGEAYLGRRGAYRLPRRPRRHQSPIRRRCNAFHIAARIDRLTETSPKRVLRPPPSSASNSTSRCRAVVALADRLRRFGALAALRTPSSSTKTAPLPAEKPPDTPSSAR
jgi:hypothetical protein